MAATCVSYSADGRTLAFLRPAPGSTVSSLYGVDIESGAVNLLLDATVQGGDSEATLSLEEKLRRERSRTTATGITSFTWTAKNAIVYPSGGNLHVFTPGSGSPSLLCEKGSGGALIDPTPAPDGSRIAVVQDGEVYVCAVQPGAGPAKLVQVTAGARERGHTHGLADYIAQEEFDRFTGLWWSPCGRYLAIQGTDDTHIPPFRIGHMGDADPAAAEEHRYPFAGCANARVKLGVVDVHAALSAAATTSLSAAMTWMDLGDNEDIYLARVNWMSGQPGGTAEVVAGSVAAATASVPVLLVQLLNRRQDVLDLVRYDIATGAGVLLLREAAYRSWINVNHLLQPLPSHVRPPLPAHGGGGSGSRPGSRSSSPSASSTASASAPGLSPAQQAALAATRYFLWGSERSGYQHLYLYAMPAHAAAYAGAPRYAGPPVHPPPEASLGGVGGVGGAGGAQEDNDPILAAMAGASPASPSPSPSSPAAASGSAPRGYVQEVGGAAVQMRIVTSGQWAVDGVAGVGGANGRSGDPAVFITGTLDSPLEKHLYVVPIFGGDEVKTDFIYGIPGIRRLTSGAGMHGVTLSPQCDTFADSLSTLHAPPSLAVYSYDPTARYVTSPFKGAPSPSASSSGGAGAGSGVVGSAVKQRLAAAEAALPHSHPMHSLLASIQSFEKTGAYGPRISMGVRMVALPHGALPVATGTPAIYTDARSQLLKCAAASVERAAAAHAAAAASAADGHPLSKVVASASAALDGLAAAVSSKFGRFESLGERAGALLAGMSPATSNTTSSNSNSNSTGQEGGNAPPSAAAAAAAIAAAAPPAPDAATTGAAAAAAAPPSVAIPVAPAAVATAGSTASSSSAAASPLSSPAPAVPSAAAATPVPPLLFSLPAADKLTRLYGALHLPDPATHGYGPYPLVVSVYGGPHVQRVKHDWSLTNELRAQALRRGGFAVVTVDNRGSSRRGLAFELPIRHAMGSVEVADQIAAVQYLSSCGIIDSSRVGVYGWSYGGYMTLMCLAQGGATFRVGVAGAPVTSWDGYDTGYTERYMGTPQAQAAAYHASSVQAHAGGISGHLLLVHGLLDENVHARHTTRLIQTLIEANIAYDCLLFPNERHLPRGAADKAYMEARIMRYFQRYLQ